MEKPLYQTIGAQTRATLAICVGLFVVIHGIWVMWLFPAFDIGGAFYFILLVPLSIGAGAFVYYLLDFPRVLRSRRAVQVLLVLSVPVGVVLFELATDPVLDFSQNPYVQIGQNLRAFWDYPGHVGLQDLVSSDHAANTTAMMKYADMLPPRMLVLEIRRPSDPWFRASERYAFGLPFDGPPLYDPTALDVVGVDGGFVFMTKPRDAANAGRYTFSLAEANAALNGQMAFHRDASGAAVFLDKFYQPSETGADLILKLALRTVK